MSGQQQNIPVGMNLYIYIYIHLHTADGKVYLSLLFVDHIEAM